VLGLPFAVGAPPLESGGFERVMMIGEHADILDADAVGEGHVMPYDFD